MCPLRVNGDVVDFVLDVGGREVRESAADSQHPTQRQEENILSVTGSVKQILFETSKYFNI